MRHLKIQTTPPSIPQLGILTRINELSKHEMIYIYHHLKIGSELFLERDKTRLWDQHAVAVFYKGFKIGYVSDHTSGLICKQLDKGLTILAKVKTLYKQKYMPLDGLDIEVFIS
ncbi:MAG: HIRAN domain-containing protein [Flavobacteriales bacterium]|jgi:hypothetical protein|nr:HIRAN domain-containing protein [Flavobacteriales bacterium]